MRSGFERSHEVTTGCSQKGGSVHDERNFDSPLTVFVASSVGCGVAWLSTMTVKSLPQKAFIFYNQQPSILVSMYISPSYLLVLMQLPSGSWGPPESYNKQ